MVSFRVSQVSCPIIRLPDRPSFPFITYDALGKWYEDFRVGMATNYIQFSVTKTKLVCYIQCIAVVYTIQNIPNIGLHVGTWATLYALIALWSESSMFAILFQHCRLCYSTPIKFSNSVVPEHSLWSGFALFEKATVEIANKSRLRFISLT